MDLLMLALITVRTSEYLVTVMTHGQRDRSSMIVGFELCLRHGRSFGFFGVCFCSLDRGLAMGIPCTVSKGL